MSKKRRFGHKTYKPKSPRINARQGKRREQPSSVDSNGENGTSEDDSMIESHGRGGDSGKLLTNPNQTVADARLINRAIRGRWGVRRKGMIRRRLEDIVSKTQQDELFSTREGIIREPSEDLADKNAVAAAKVLVQMNNQDQEDDHFEVNKGKAANPVPVQVNILNANNLEPGQSRILQLAQSLGASHLTIDGSEVRVTDSVGESKEA